MMYMTIFAAGAVTAPLAGKGITRFGYPAVMGAAAFLLLLGGMMFGFLLRNIEPKKQSNEEFALNNASGAD